MSKKNYNSYKNFFGQAVTGTSGTFISPSEEDKLATYPNSKDLKINQSDLKLELIHFAKANEDKPNLSLLIGLISVWIAIFTADFRDTFWIKADYINMIVFTLAIISTVFIGKSILISLYRFIVSFSFFRKLFNADKWIHENEIDPERKAKSIIKRCEIDK